jgi:predicted lipase
MDDSIRNWVVDFLFPKTTVWKGQNASIQVHSGFYHSYMNLADQVRAAVQDLVTLYPDYTVGVTGHSLGAALATLCVLDIVEEGIVPRDNVMVYHFGSPRVGNDGFAQYYHFWIPYTFRLVNDRDIVPALPPQILKFHHVATEVWEHGNNYEQCDDSGEDPNCSDSVISWSSQDHVFYMQVETCECQPCSS